MQGPAEKLKMRALMLLLLNFCLMDSGHLLGWRLWMTAYCDGSPVGERNTVKRSLLKNSRPVLFFFTDAYKWI
jgi:hypothetical protein